MSAEEKFYERRHCQAPREAFDNGQGFEAAFKRPGHRYFCVHDFILRPADLDVLECGVGSINTCAFLARHFRRYVATDISANLGREVESRIGFVQHNLNERWPFSDAQFDAVIAMMVFEHLFDPFFAFSETARVLRPGGIAMVNLPLITSVRNRLRLLVGQLPMTSSQRWWDEEEWDGGHLHLFTIDSVRRLAAKYGLSLLKTYPCGRLTSLKRFWPAGLCGELSFVFRKEG
jgi:SAM-dependent methyltransferase